MALRLALMSMVAGLGLTLPTGGQLAGWKDSAKLWVTANLARWDARMPSGPDAFVVVNEPTPFQRPALPEATIPEPADDPVAPWRREGPALLAEDAGFQNAVDEMLREFAEAEPEPSVTAESVVVRPEFEPLEVGEDLYEGIAFELNRGAEGLDLPPCPPAVEAIEARSYEPLVVGEDLYEGIAYELNRQAEGLTLEAPHRSAKEGGRLTKAVQLTREAVFAWANLLQGPAVVTAGR